MVNKTTPFSLVKALPYTQSSFARMSERQEMSSDQHKHPGTSKAAPGLPRSGWTDHVDNCKIKMFAIGSSYAWFKIICAKSSWSGVAWQGEGETHSKRKWGRLEPIFSAC